MSKLLLPVVALGAWTFVMFGWMYLTRIPAIRRARMRLDPNAPRGEQMASLPPSVRWKADNYNHLMELPTVFYAVCLVLALVGQGGGLNAGLAWAYLGIRVVHSLVQVTVNKVMLRWALFMASTLALAALVLHAAVAVFH